MMNLRKDLERSKEIITNNKNLITLNFWTILVIFIILFIETIFMFKNIVLGIIFGIISCVYLVFMFITSNKLKKIKKEYEEISE